MRIVKYYLLFLFTALIYVSCDDDICTSNTESFLNTEVIVVDDVLITNNFIDNMSIYSPEWTDSIHYLEEGTDNILSFMLSPVDSITTFIITSKQEALKDTIQIFHQSEMFFLSPKCGFILNYEIDSFTHSVNLIDSAFLVNSSITNDNNGLIQIYL